MLQKSGKIHTKTKNFKPISLPSTLPKILEKIILSNLKKFVTTKIRAIRERFHSAAVLLEMKKAFDKMWHDSPIFKLTKLDLPYPLIKLIRCFLTESRLVEHLVPKPKYSKNKRNSIRPEKQQCKNHNNYRLVHSMDIQIKISWCHH